MVNICYKCVWTQTCAERLLHLDGAEGGVRQGGKGTQVEIVEGDTQEGGHGE